MPEPIYFKSLDELDEFLANFRDFGNSQLTTGNYLLTEYFDGSGGSSSNYYKETRSIGLLTNMNISFNINNCQGSNLQSWISGFTLGVSYNHMSGSLTTINNKINYNVDGILNYNIFVEGVGTVFSENLSFSGSYQCN